MGTFRNRRKHRVPRPAQANGERMIPAIVGCHGSGKDPVYHGMEGSKAGGSPLENSVEIQDRPQGQLIMFKTSDPGPEAIPVRQNGSA